MKKILLVLSFAFVCPLFILGQNTKAEKYALSKIQDDFKCIYRARYKPSDRKKFYPFNIAGTIKLVSFRYHKNNYPVTNNSLVVDSLVEVKVLTKSGIDSLTDILYNNFYKQQPGIDVKTQCFLPRNAILFFDKKGKLKEYSLICFHCDRHQESSDKVNFGNDCSQKMRKLLQYFIAQGLMFGTSRQIQEYPGEGPDEIIK